MTLIPETTTVHHQDDRLAGDATAVRNVPETAPVESKAFSVASLVLGISSLAFGYTFIVPIVGLVLGILSLNREPSNRAMSIWGIALSGITLFGGLLAVMFGVSVLVPLGIATIFAG